MPANVVLDNGYADMQLSDELQQTEAAWTNRVASATPVFASGRDGREPAAEFMGGDLEIGPSKIGRACEPMLGIPGCHRGCTMPDSSHNQIVACQSVTDNSDLHGLVSQWRLLVWAAAERKCLGHMISFYST